MMDFEEFVQNSKAISKITKEIISMKDSTDLIWAVSSIIYKIKLVFAW